MVRKFLILACAISMIASPVFAATKSKPDFTPTSRLSQPMICGDYSIVIALLTIKYKEFPMYEGTLGSGTDEDTPFVQTFVNPVSRTWSYILVPRPGVGCFLPGGTRFRPAKIRDMPKPKGPIL